MLNIEELLKNAGVEIPAEKMETFKSDFAANYKTIAEFNKKDVKINALQETLETTQRTLKEFEGVNPEELRTTISNLQNEIKLTEERYQKDLNARDRQDAIKRELDKEKFTSPYSRKAIEDMIMGAEITYKDGKLYGYNDRMTELKESNADAFVSQAEQKRVQFTDKGNGGQSNGTSIADYYKLKTSEERQAFIREHANLFAKK